METQLSQETSPAEGMDQASSRLFNQRNVVLNVAIKAVWDEAFEAGAAFQREQQREVMHILAAECVRLEQKVGAN